MQIEVGRVTRSSTTRFAVGCQVLRPNVPAFGALVKVRAVGQDEIIGLIHDVRMDDDPYVRQVAALNEVRPEVIEDQRRNRQIPIEVGVLVVGYHRDGRVYHLLPEQPPLSLDVIHTCSEDELVSFTERFDYFRLVLNNQDLPADELLAANLRSAASARGRAGIDFLLEAGRELVRLMGSDLVRLDAILRRMRP